LKPGESSNSYAERVRRLHPAVPYQDGALYTGPTHEQQLVLDQLPHSSSVLELGCSRGQFSRLLQSNGHSVLAVEGDVRAADEARAAGIDVIAGDLESPETWAQIKGTFDTALFMHVLEHLADPWEVLRHVQDVLPPRRRVVALIPNVASWRIRRDLFLHGKFEYEDVGILDRTHLRFFTLDSALRLFEAVGLEDVTFQPVEVEIPIERRIRVHLRLPGLARLMTREATRRIPNLAVSIVLVSGWTPGRV
jgi:SAM-dependent methyltransferase